MATAQDALRVAAGELGYSRWEDELAGSKYGRWYASLGHGAYFGSSGVPFCAMGVSWVLEQIGMTPPGGHFAYVPYGINAARNRGRLVDVYDAQPGDLVCFDWDLDGEADHVGMIEANYGSYVQTIEFNTSGSWAGSQSNGGGVYRRTRDWDSICAMIRPDYDGNEFSGANAAAEAAEVITEGEPYRERLEVDGDWGARTTAAYQTLKGTYVDGVVSNQDEDYQEHLPAAGTGWEWGSNPEEGSEMVKALQKALGLEADGIFGPKTAEAFQFYYKVKVDGYVGEESVKAFQRAINRQNGFVN